MKLEKNIALILITGFILLAFNCKEEFEIQNQDFESVLVVEATITNELKHQEVKLSRTYLLEDNEQLLESNAEVRIDDNNGNSYNFYSNSDGIYVSNVAFKALVGNEYILHITTAGDENYISSPTILTPSATINNLYAELVNGENVTVFIDVDGTENDAQYFRYKWEETYKIIAPYHSNFDGTIINFDDTNGQLSYDIEITPRAQEEKICFSSSRSKDIIQASSSDLVSNTITRFAVRSLDIKNSKLITRYSLLVTQISQDIASYSYYKTINKLGNNASILSETQPGYIPSNIKSFSNSNEKVLGFFEVASVTSERIYFNYTDFNINAPDYFYDCEVLELDYSDNTTEDSDTNERVKLYQRLALANFKYVSHASTFYKIVRPECGDCTSFSSNVQPDFWQD